MKYILLNILAVVFISMGMVSCTKVIDVNLNKTEPKIVIQGAVTDADNPHVIKISKTTDLDKDNVFPAVSGASVTIADDAGNTELLKETAPGIYESYNISGIPGRTYTLTVIAEGNTYTSTSTMPQKIAFDSLGLTPITVPSGKEVNFPTVFYRDPAVKGNYYRAVLYINGELDKEIYVESDEFINGKDREARLVSLPSPFEDQDKIRVDMQCIDKQVYEYLSELIEADGSSQLATPSNPTSNISNGALGYFSAHTTETKTLTYYE